MAKIFFGTELIESPKTIKKLALDSTRSVINSALPRVADAIERRIKKEIRSRLQNTSVYSSLTEGDSRDSLRFNFGLTVGEAVVKMNDIIDILISEIQVVKRQVRLTGEKFTGGITVFLFDSTFKKILSTASGFVTTKKGQELHWMRWLILEGNKVVVKDYDIIFGSFTGSRSGGAIMIPSNRKDVFGSSPGWKVPARFAGTIKNNWITRFASNVERVISNIVSDSFNRLF